MISVSQAEKIIFNNIRTFQTAVVPLTDAYGRVLHEDIKADRPQPAFDKALMDGIAISSRAWQKGIRKFTMEGIAPAGQAARRLKHDDGCIQIMTGAVLSKDCDCVIPVEQIMIKNNCAVVSAAAVVKPMQNIRLIGADRKKGELLLRKGCQLLPPHIATAASIGKSKLKVSAKPKVAIISNGDELVDIDKKSIQPFQIRKSNSYALHPTFAQTGLCESKMFHFPDDKKILLREIGKILVRFDILVLSGGVSMGEFDYIPQVLKELGVQVLFHKVSQKPGRPFWFGKSRNGQPVFALPGNPVSTQICAYRYVVPYIRYAAGLNLTTPRVILSEAKNDFIKKLKIPEGFTYFLPVKIRYHANAQMEAIPVAIGGSGDYAALAQADGFVELGGEVKNIRKNLFVAFYSWNV